MWSTSISQEWKTKNEKFRLFVNKAENNYLSHRLTFNELIPIAWQRLTKYKLLIEGMCKTYKKHTEELDGERIHVYVQYMCVCARCEYVFTSVILIPRTLCVCVSSFITYMYLQGSTVQ